MGLSTQRERGKNKLEIQFFEYSHNEKYFATRDGGVR
jgi:hypothetical protein